MEHNYLSDYKTVINKVTSYKEFAEKNRSTELASMLGVITQDLENWHNSFHKKKVDAKSFHEAILSFDEYIDTIIVTYPDIIIGNKSLI